MEHVSERVSVRLEHEGRCTSPVCLPVQVGVDFRSDNHDDSGGMTFADQLRCGNSVQPAQADVGHDHIGPQSLRQHDERLAIAHDAFQVEVHFQEPLEGTRNFWMIFCQDKRRLGIVPALNQRIVQASQSCQCFFACEVIPRQMITAAMATAMDCITTYPPGVARKARMMWADGYACVAP